MVTENTDNSVKSSNMKRSGYDPDKITIKWIRKLRWNENHSLNDRNFDIIAVFCATPKNNIDERIEAILIAAIDGLDTCVTEQEARRIIRNLDPKDIAEYRERLIKNKYD